MMPSFHDQLLHQLQCQGALSERGARELVSAALTEATEKSTATGGEATPELTVYRAQHDSIPIGLYTTREAARAHCEALLRREEPGAEIAWTDEDEGAQDLTFQVDGEFQDWSGYIVTALDVASEYDEESDE